MDSSTLSVWFRLSLVHNNDKKKGLCYLYSWYMTSKAISSPSRVAVHSMYIMFLLVLSVKTLTIKKSKVRKYIILFVNKVQ